MSSMSLGELIGHIGLDTTELQRQADMAGRAVEDMTDEILQAVREVERQRATVRLDADAAAAEREIAALRQQLADIQSKPAEARVEGDTRDVEEQLARVEERLARINGERVRIRIDADATPVDRASMSARQLGDAAASAASKVGGISAAIPAVAGLVAVLGSAAAAAAVLPALLGGLAAGIGTVKLGFGGIGDAISAAAEADSAGGSTAAAAGAAREAAIQRVEAAYRSLAQAQEQARRQEITGAWQIQDAQDAVAEAVRRADQVAIDSARDVAAARQAVADAYAAAASRVEAAEASLERAQVGAADAQEALNRAREDATERIEDMQLALSGAALDEEAAQLRLLRAQQRLQKAGTNKNTLDYREAELGVRQAEQALKETSERYGDVQKEAEEANSKGVEGADEVVAAQRRVQDANQQVADAQKGLAQARVDGDRQIAAAEQALADATTKAAQDRADAERQVEEAKRNLQRTQLQVSWAQQDAAERVAEAERQVAQAIKDASAAAAAGAGGVDKYAEAMAKLSPAGRELVQALMALKPQWDALRMDVQEAMLAGVGDEVTALAGIYLPHLREMLVGVAGDFNGAFHDVSGLLQTEEATNKVAYGFGNIRTSLGIAAQAAEPLTQVLLDLFSVGSEFLPGMSQGFLDWANSLRETVSAAAESGRLRDMIQQALDVLGQLWEIGKNVFSIITGIFAAGAGQGSGLLDALIGITGAISDIINSAVGQEVLRTLFQILSDAAPVLVPLGLGLMTLAKIWQAVSLVMKIQSAIMAASWLTAFGPVALIVAGVIALVALIIANWDSIVAATQWLVDRAGELLGWFAGLPDMVAEWFGAAKDWAIQKMLDLITWLSGGVDQAGSILGWFAGLPGMFSEWFNSAKDWAIRKALDLITWLGGMPGQILSALSSVPSLLVSVGRDLVTGFWNGIQGMGRWLYDSILGWVRSFVPGPILDFLGIASPSKWMRDNVGRWIPEGLAVGIEANSDVASDAALAMAASTADVARAGMAGALDSSLAVSDAELARIEAFANTGRDPGPAASGAAANRGGATVNVYNPLPERSSDSLNREARTLEALGVL